MRIINLYDLYETDYSVNSVAAYSVATRPGQKYSRNMNTGRVLHGLVYNLCGSFDYTCGGRVVSAGDNEIVYLPKHAKYFHVACGSAEGICRTAVINFNLYGCGGEELFLGGDIIKLGEINGSSLAHNFGELLEIYRGKRNPAKINVSLIGLLERIGKKYRELMRNDKKFSLIRPAVERIEQSGSGVITVAELARMCYMSENAFRGVFKEYYRETPSQMLYRLRIEQAKGLLLETTLSVREVAEKLEIADVSYFCKMFKRYTGLSPGKYR